MAAEISKQILGIQLSVKIRNRRIVTAILFSVVITFFVLGGIFSSNILLAFGFATFILTFIILLCLTNSIKVIRKNIEKCCPKCNKPLLELTSTQKEDTGRKVKMWSSSVGGEGAQYKKRILLVTEQYTCSDCGEKTLVKTHKYDESDLPY